MQHFVVHAYYILKAGVMIMKGRKEKIIQYSVLFKKMGILTGEDLETIANLNKVSLQKKGKA